MRQGLVEQGIYREQENSHLGPDHSRRREGKTKKKGGKGRNKSASLVDDTCMHAHAHSVTHAHCHVRLFVTLWNVAHQAPLSMGFSRHTGVGCHSLLHRIFLTQESKLGLLHCQQIIYQLSYEGSPK